MEQTADWKQCLVQDCKQKRVRGKGIRNINPLTPNDDYSGRTAPLTSKR